MRELTHYSCVPNRYNLTAPPTVQVYTSVTWEILRFRKFLNQFRVTCVALGTELWSVGTVTKHAYLYPSNFSSHLLVSPQPGTELWYYQISKSFSSNLLSDRTMVGLFLIASDLRRPSPGPHGAIMDIAPGVIVTNLYQKNEANLCNWLYFKG